MKKCNYAPFLFSKRQRRSALLGSLFCLCFVLIGCSASSPTSVSPQPTTSLPSPAPTATPTGVTPPNRGDTQMVYDDQMGALLLFSGQQYVNPQPLDDTWAWDGTNWTQLHPAYEPPPRTDAAMAYDPATQQVVLFGGLSLLGNTPIIGDTWTWNGSDWMQQHPTTSPPARDFANMAYDTATSQLILFGGGSAQKRIAGTVPPPLADTWTWNGSNWVQLHPTTSPSTRAGATLAYDPATRNLILFGGGNVGQSLNDTWTWNGSTWTELSPTTKPALTTTQQGENIAFDHPNMVYDATTGKMLLLFGGGANSGNTDILLQWGWSWDGSNWSHISATSPGPNIDDGNLVYDAQSQAVFELTFFIANTSVTADIKLWKWTGQQWTVVEHWTQ